MQTNLRYNLALSMLNNVGAVTAKKLIAYCGSAEEVFNTSDSKLLKIPDIGEYFIRKLNKNEALQLADKELLNMENNNIKVVFSGDKDYPERLTNCNDAPYSLYYKGQININTTKIISIVGTRYASNYGKDICAKLIKDIVDMGFRPIIVSGLAYGIDISAHKAALVNGLDTFAILGTGVQKIYPATHSNVAREIEKQGALISEFHSSSKIVPGNFASRNRIIAGMSEATIVIESPEKGGSLITADIANSYNRDVLAFPGRATDTQSVGCNNLIKRNIAALIDGAEDIVKILNWDLDKKPPKQLNIFQKDLSPEEQIILDFLHDDSKSVEDISKKTDIKISQLHLVLLNMEFSNLIKAIPGNRYRKL